MSAPFSASGPEPEPLCRLDAAGLIDEDIACGFCGYNLRTTDPRGACPECGQSVPLGLARRLEQSRKFTLLNFPIWARVFYALFGIAPAAWCFFAASQDPHPPVPEWQSGEFFDIWGMSLGWDASWPFYFLASYATLSLLAFLFIPTLAASRRFYRWGVLAGVLLSIQYLILFGPTLVSLASNFYGLGYVFLALPFLFAGVRLWVATWKPRRRWPRWIGPAYATLFLGGLVLMWWFDASDNLLIVGWLLAPCWVLLVYFFLAVRIRRTPGLAPARGRWWLVGLVAWWTAWVATWALAIRNAIVAYHALPTTPTGGCYICTAAARGHPNLVGSREVELHGGYVMRVNRQMRVLKAGELALLAVAPRTHRLCRRIYDALGPRLAARLTHPLLADAAYLALAPFATLASLTLRAILPDADRLIARLYR